MPHLSTRALAWSLAAMLGLSGCDAGPAATPPALVGVWREIGPKEFEAKYEFFATRRSEPEAFQKGAGWLPAGGGVITERITLSADGQAFSSSLQFQAFDAQGKSVEGGGVAKGHAVRIRQ